MESYLAVLKALADDTRLHIVRILHRGGAFNVNELVGILAMGQSRVSRHLKILSDAGLLEARRQGTWVYYRLSRRWSANGSGGPRFLRLLGRELAAQEVSWHRERLDACLEARRAKAEHFFRGVAAGWDRHRDQVQGPAVYVPALTAAVCPGGEAPETVVDLGTGTGILLPHLSSRARHVIGIDASTEMLRQAGTMVREKGLDNVELRLGRLEHLPLPDGAADVMVANMVLHHVAHPPDALREMRRGLRAGGRLLVADLNAHGDETYRERLGDLWLGFEADELERWVADADFDIERHEEFVSNVGSVPTDKESEDENTKASTVRPSVRLLVARRKGDRPAEI